MRVMFFLATVSVLGGLCAAEKPYTCSLKVGNPKLEQTLIDTEANNGKNGGAKGGAAQGGAKGADDALLDSDISLDEMMGEVAPKAKAPKGKGKDAKSKPPPQGKIMRRKLTWPVTVSFRGKDFPSAAKLLCAYIGTKDGAPAILGKGEVGVTLDKNGIFKTEVSSPEAEMVKTRKTSGGGKKGGGTTSEITGERLSGCVIQLVVGGEVLRSYATKPTWAKLAKKNPLPEEEILKYR